MIRERAYMRKPRAAYKNSGREWLGEVSEKQEQEPQINADECRYFPASEFCKIILAEGATTARKYRLRQTSVKEGEEMSAEGGRMTEIGEMRQQLNGTRMPRIRRIFTDTFYPCASVSSAQSVFYRVSELVDEEKKPQMNADERRYFPVSEFSKIIHCKGRKERKAHRMSYFWILKTTESAMNLPGSSMNMKKYRWQTFSYQGTEDTEKRNKPLCSLCSPWSIILAGINYCGYNARALEYSIFTQGETIGGGNLA